MKKIIIAIITACSVLSGCAINVQQPGSTQLLTDTDTGSYPDLFTVQTYLANRLKDPDSAKFKMSTFEKCYMREAPITGGKISQYGWCGRVALNAKNSYGAYVGFKEYRIFVSSIGAIREYSANPWFVESWFRE